MTLDFVPSSSSFPLHPFCHDQCSLLYSIFFVIFVRFRCRQVLCMLTPFHTYSLESISPNRILGKFTLAARVANREREKAQNEEKIAEREEGLAAWNKQHSFVSQHHVVHFQSMYLSPFLLASFVIRLFEPFMLFHFHFLIVKSYVFAINFCLPSNPTATRPKYVDAENDLFFFSLANFRTLKKAAISPLSPSNYGHCFRAFVWYCL